MTQKVFAGGHPSIEAASSYVLERVAKKFNKYVVVDGTCMRIYRRISKILPLIPSRVVNAKIGMIIMTAGTLIAIIRQDYKGLYAKNSKRDNT